MEVYIGTERLDMPAQGTSMHYGRMRFGSSLGDDYSTDIEVPKTAKNLRLLGAYMVEEGNLIGLKIPASVIIGNISEDGYVTVNAIYRDSIHVAVFVRRIPGNFLDRKLGDLIHDDATTTIAWDEQTRTASLSALVGLWPYYQGVTLPPNIHVRYCKPSIKLSKVLSMVADATGVTINAPNVGDVVLTPTKMVESPASMVQVLTKKSMSEQTRRGSSYYSVPEDENTYGIQITAEADINVDLYVQNPTMARGSVDYAVNIIDNDGSTHSIISLNLDVQHGVRHLQGSYHVNPGYKLRLAITLNGDAGSDVETAVVINYTNVTNADNEEHALTIYRSQVIANQVFHHQNFGIISNLADVTMRDLLSSIAWAFGKVIKSTPDSVSFVDSTTIEIDGETIEINGASDVLAKTVRVVDASNRDLFVGDVTGDYLQDSIEQHKSSFFFAPRRSASMYEATIPEFALNDDGSLAEGKVVGIPISIPRVTTDEVPNGTYLRPMAMSRELFVAPYRALGAVIETFDDVTGADFVTINQHTYAVVEVDKDIDTGLSTINAVKI